MLAFEPPPYNTPMPLADERREYCQPPLDESAVHADPIAQFRRWLDDALAAEFKDATAMTLATADERGRPSARVVLLKGVDEHGFVFYTDYQSRKGLELAANPAAALLFYWSPFDRQVRIEGRVNRISRERSAAYFQARPRTSQLAAAASEQSRILPDRAALERQYAALEARCKDQPVPLPDRWGGYVLVPTLIEFWQGRPHRLHDRLRYCRQPDNTWQIDRLAP